MERRAALRKLIEPDPRCPIQFSDHADCDGALFFKHAAELGLEGIVSKRARSLYRGGPSKNWLKTKNMVEGEFILLGTEVDDSGIPWALLAREQDGELEFAGPAISDAIACQGRMDRQVRGDVDREAGIEGAEASQQSAMAEAGDQGQGSAPQGEGHPQARDCEVLDRILLSAKRSEFSSEVTAVLLAYKARTTQTKTSM